MNNLTIKSDSGQTYNITGGDETSLEINGELLKLDIYQKENGFFHVLREGKSYSIAVEAFDIEEKSVLLNINGKEVAYKISTELDVLLKKMGININAKNKSTDLKAPMPGLIHSIIVSEGDKVSKGDALLILEAMKMENVIKAQEDLIIGKIHIKSGQTVEKGFKMISFG